MCSFCEMILISSRLLEDTPDRNGCETLTDRDGEQPVEDSKSARGVEIVITDIMMPKGDGVEVGRKTNSASNGVRSHPGMRVSGP